MNQQYATYKQIDITTSNPMKIVLMLYDGAIQFLQRSVKYAENSDIKNKNIYANKARDIIVELNNSLDMKAGGDLAQNLGRIYLFMNRHLLQANWSNDINAVKEVIQLLTNLREAWQDVYDQNAAEQSQRHRQAVGMRV
jgi:flagellar protein FliS